MRDETLVYQKAGAVCTISINRPTVDNAINMRLAEELADICAGINRDEEARVVVITGVGDRAFSIGIDPKELSSAAIDEQEAKLLSVAAPVASFTVPVIAAI